MKKFINWLEKLLKRTEESAKIESVNVYKSVSLVELTGNGLFINKEKVTMPTINLHIHGNVGEIKGNFANIRVDIGVLGDINIKSGEIIVNGDVGGDVKTTSGSIIANDVSVVTSESGDIIINGEIKNSAFSRLGSMTRNWRKYD